MKIKVTPRIAPCDVRTNVGFVVTGVVTTRSSPTPAPDRGARSGGAWSAAASPADLDQRAAARRRAACEARACDARVNAGVAAHGLFEVRAGAFASPTEELGTFRWRQTNRNCYPTMPSRQRSRACWMPKPRHAMPLLAPAARRRKSPSRRARRHAASVSLPTVAFAQCARHSRASRGRGRRTGSARPRRSARLPISRRRKSRAWTRAVAALGRRIDRRAAVIDAGSLEYAHARLCARYGDRPDELAWRRIEMMREFGAMLDTARTSPLAAWIAEIGPDATCTRIELALRAHLRARIAAIAAWMPPAWRASIEWCAVAGRPAAAAASRTRRRAAAMAARRPPRCCSCATAIPPRRARGGVPPRRRHARSGSRGCAVARGVAAPPAGP